MQARPRRRLSKYFKNIQTGENVRRRGMDIKTGYKILFAGTRLRAQEVGLLAMLGVANLSVYRKPRVALLSSGDELTPVELRLAPGNFTIRTHTIIGADRRIRLRSFIARDRTRPKRRDSISVGSSH